MKKLKPETRAFKKLTVFHDDFQQAYDAVIELMKYKGVESKVLLIVGQNGCGKSRLVHEISQSFPTKDSDEETIIPILRADTPPETGTSALISELLHGIGDLDAYVGRPQKLRDRLRKLIKELRVDLIIIDEIQDVFPIVGLSNASKATKFVKWMANNSGTPILMLGTYESLSLLDISNALNQRAEPTKHLHSFNCKDEDEQFRFADYVTDLFDAFPRTVKGFNFYKKDEDGDEVLKDDIKPLLQLCLACRGIPRNLSDILTKVIENTEPKDVVDGEIFGEAWKKAINHKNGWEQEVYPFTPDLKVIKTELIAKKLFTKPIKGNK